MITSQEMTLFTQGVSERGIDLELSPQSAPQSFQTPFQMLDSPLTGAAFIRINSI